MANTPDAFVENLHTEGSPVQATAAAAANKPSPKTPSPPKTPSNNKTASAGAAKKEPTSSSSKENRKVSSRPSLVGLNKTYEQLVHEAILALKDRTGSSVPAISKYILQQYSEFLQDGSHFRRNLNAALKTGVKKQHFQKLKASYKISAAYKEAERSKKRKAKRKKEQQQQQQKKTKKKPHLSSKEQLAKTQASNAKKLKELEKKEISPEELDKIKLELAKKEEAARRKAEAEAKAKERAERLRRRRFPMEDTKLHAEDKELGVKAPADVHPRPYLPYFWNLTLPLGDPGRSGKTSSSILQASKVDGLDLGSNGLVPDLLQVYHFFRGDVHFTGPDSEVYHQIVPDFSLQQLLFAVEQVSNGNARKSRMIPPLLCHLFVTCLQILFLPPDATVTDKHEHKLRQDLHDKLMPALSPSSWAEVCTLYMDAVDRHYRTDASRDPTVLPSLAIDIKYLLGVTDTPVVPMTPAIVKKKEGADDHLENDASVLPDRYHGYLGDMNGALYRAHSKLFRQDPWMLTAEELMALLRALTDDILASNPNISENIAAREEEMQELLRAKRAADAKFRKVRLAFEGPKRPTKKPAVGAEAAEEKKTENGKNEAEETDGKAAKAEEPFKPTATKKQFETAKRQQQKASDAYEKGIRNLVARTEPIGYDRNFNAVYCFRHDPEVLYVEDVRPASGVVSSIPDEMQFQRRSWHIIETTSLFDRYVNSLDIRGKREHDLYEELLGPQGAQQSLRRFLHDDVKEKADANAKIKEMEALKQRLEIARIKCDEEQGRRSGRLAGQAEVELSQIEDEIHALEQEANGVKEQVDERDFAELTGLEDLRRFDRMGQMDKRRSREAKATKERYVPLLSCSNICGSGHIDGTGVVGMIVSAMLEVEELCESLIPWEKGDSVRDTWISNLENAVLSWDSITPDLLGPPDTPRKLVMKIDADEMNGQYTPTKDGRRASLGSTESSASKRRRLDGPSTPGGFGAPSIPTIITQLKAPLLELEKRVADITNLDVASRDADLADENMSSDGSEDDQAEKERLELAWKRLLHKIRETPTRRYVQIRELLVSAISAARKAHVPEVVAQLRAALLLHHPAAAGDCKNAAVKVLENFGDYDEEDDDYAEEEEEAEDEINEKDEIPSVVSLEAAVLTSCFEGSEEASRSDWIESVKSVKTISRMAALACAFCQKAKEKLGKTVRERDDLQDALVTWEKQEDRKTKSRVGKGRCSPKEYDGPSEVWADAKFTSEICMVKVEDYPWWPARMCQAKDSELAKSLEHVQRALVALVGEMGSLRIVQNERIQPFTGKAIEDESSTEMSKGIRSELHECISMARRILRSRQQSS